MTLLIRRTLFAAAIVLLVSPRPAAADSLTIGEFLYDTDAVLGPVFTVENFSDAAITGGGSFTDIVLRLYSGATDLQDISLDSLDAGLTLDTSFYDLSQVSFDSAVLALTFSLPGAIDVAPLISLKFDVDATDPDNPFFFGNSANAFISFTPAQSVPEPSTLLLTACGVAVVVRRRASGRPFHFTTKSRP